MRIDQFISGQAIDRLGDILLLVGLDGSILDANSAALNCFGYSHDEILALSVHDIRAPQDQDTIDGQMREAAQHSVLFETVDRRSDGALFPVEVRSASVSLNGDTALLSIVRDITERTKAERELRESESRYRALAERSPSAIFVNRDGKVVFANPACAVLFGATSPEELIGKTALDLFDADSRALVRERIRVDSQTAPLVEVRIVRLDGTPVDVEAAASPLLDRGARAIQVLLHDITERKQADRKLRESESRYRALAESSPLAIFVNRDDEVVLANPACAALFGAASPEDLIGRAALDLFDPDSQALVRERIRVDSETVPLVEVRIVRLDGTSVDVEATASPFLDQGVRAIQVVLRDITERKLLDAEARHRALVESSPVAIFVNRDDKVVLANPACAALFGAASPEELIGKTALDLFDADSQALVVERIRVDSETVPLVEVRIVRLDGTSVDVEATASPFLDQGIRAIQVVLRDITETKKTHERAARLAAIVTSSFDAVITKDLDEKVTNWNPAAEALYGYTEEEIVGTSIEVLQPPGREGEPRQLTERLLQGERIPRFETQRKRKDGRLVDVSLTLSPIRDDAGDVVSISVIARDITERRQAEEERLRAERFFRDTFEHADVGIAHVDSASGAWLRVNQRLCDLLGYTREELLHTTFAALTHPDDVEQDVRHLGRMLAGEEATYATEKRYLRADGSIVWAHLNVALIHDEDGTPDYNVTVLTDITERKLAEEALRESETKLAALNKSLERRVARRTHQLTQAVGDLVEANEAKTRFLRSMSHELRTPLNSVIGFASLLADGIPGEVNEEQSRQLAMIKASGQHLLSLINDILDLSRIEAGKAEVHTEPIDVPELLDELVTSVSPAAKVKELELEFLVSDPPPGLSSDLMKVRQILLNFLANAIKFTDEGRVVLRAFAPSRHLVAFSVTDTGPGIAAQERGRIFGEFERAADQAPTTEGTGLGLSIARELADLLGGTIDLVSEEGTGSTFTLTLPQEPGPSKE